MKAGHSSFCTVLGSKWRIHFKCLFHCARKLDGVLGRGRSLFSYQAWRNCWSLVWCFVVILFFILAQTLLHGSGSIIEDSGMGSSPGSWIELPQSRHAEHQPPLPDGRSSCPQVLALPGVPPHSSEHCISSPEAPDCTTLGLLQWQFTPVWLHWNPRCTLIPPPLLISLALC